MVVFAVTDRSNGPPPAGLIPLVIFIALMAIGTSLGMQTGYALNPVSELYSMHLLGTVSVKSVPLFLGSRFWPSDCIVDGWLLKRRTLPFPLFVLALVSNHCTDCWSVSRCWPL